MPSLQELPLPLAIIVAAFYVIQSNNASFAKQLVALIDAFGKEYGIVIRDYRALVQTQSEDRQDARQRWIERDRLLNERLEKNTTELAQNRSETHQLRNAMQSLVATIELIRREIMGSRGTGTRRTGGKPPDAGT